MLIKIIVLEINSTLKGIRKHHIDFLGGDQGDQGVTSSIFFIPNKAPSLPWKQL